MVHAQKVAQRQAHLTPHPMLPLCRRRADAFDRLQGVDMLHDISAIKSVAMPVSMCWKEGCCVLNSCTTAPMQIMMPSLYGNAIMASAGVIASSASKGKFLL